MALPIGTEIELLERELARLQEQIRALRGISDGDRDILDEAIRRMRERTRRLEHLRRLRAASRARLAARATVYAALAYLLIAAVADRFVPPPTVTGGSGPCAPESTRKYLVVENSSYGPNSSLKQAMDEIQQMCASTRLNCADPKCTSCGPDIVIQSVDVKNRVFWYTTEIKAFCQCWCR